MSALVKAESVTLLSALESTLGVQPTTGWRQHQPNADGIQDFYPKIKKVARSPLSKNRQNEKGDVVDLDSAPKIVQDLNKDWLDHFGEGIVLAKTKHCGGTGLAFFRPTAVSSTVYTVAALGALQTNTLVFARGFKVAGNNGLKPVTAGATGTTIPAAGLAAETVSGYLATLEVAGWRGAATDIGLDVNGNLTSIAADFTTMGLFPGMIVWIGGVAAANSFATAAYRGYAEISIVAAHLITFKWRQWTVAAADPGTGKLIDVYFGRWLRNVAIDDTDYQEASYQLELSLPGAAAAAATDYKYAAGNLVDTFEVMAPLTDKATSTITFCGTSMTDPTITRATGAATADAPLATAALNTVTEETYVKVIDTSGNPIAVDISSWKLTLQNNVSPQKQQGTFGAARMIVGKCIVGVDLELFYVQDDAEKAIRSNITLMFGAGLHNGDGGVFFNVPSLTFADGAPKFPANGPVTISPKAEAFRDSTLGYTLGIMLFPFLPAS